MKPVKQEFLHRPDIGQQGDCLRACLASVLELPIASVPHFAQETVGSADFWNAVYDWLDERGLNWKHTDYHDLVAGRFYIVGGPSPRDGHHAVISDGLSIVFDPHPSNDGLAGDYKEWRFAEITPL